MVEFMPKEAIFQAKHLWQHHLLFEAGVKMWKKSPCSHLQQGILGILILVLSWRFYFIFRCSLHSFHLQGLCRFLLSLLWDSHNLFFMFTKGFSVCHVQYLHNILTHTKDGHVDMFTHSHSGQIEEIYKLQGFFVFADTQHNLPFRKI